MRLCCLVLYLDSELAVLCCEKYLTEILEYNYKSLRIIFRHFSVELVVSSGYALKFQWVFLRVRQKFGYFIPRVFDF